MTGDKAERFNRLARAEVIRDSKQGTPRHTANMGNATDEQEVNQANRKTETSSLVL